MMKSVLQFPKIKDHLKPNNPYKVNAELYCKLPELAIIRDVRAGGKFTVKSNLLIRTSELQNFFQKFTFYCSKKTFDKNDLNESANIS